MTTEQEQQLLEDVAEMKTALLGTYDDRRKGIVVRTAQHDEDLNGTERDPTSGIKYRQKAIEVKLMRMEWWVRGLIAASVAMASAASWILTHWKEIRP